MFYDTVELKTFVKHKGYRTFHLFRGSWTKRWGRDDIDIIPGLGMGPRCGKIRLSGWGEEILFFSISCFQVSV